jgi:hypothetical protein
MFERQICYFDVHLVPPDLLEVCWIGFLGFRMAWRKMLIPVAVDIVDGVEKRTWNADFDCQCPLQHLLVMIRILPYAVAEKARRFRKMLQLLSTQLAWMLEPKVSSSSRPQSSSWGECVDSKDFAQTRTAN